LFIVLLDRSLVDLYKDSGLHYLNINESISCDDSYTSNLYTVILLDESILTETPPLEGYLIDGSIHFTEDLSHTCLPFIHDISEDIITNDTIYIALLCLLDDGIHLSLDISPSHTFIIFEYPHLSDDTNIIHKIGYVESVLFRDPELWLDVFWGIGETFVINDLSKDIVSKLESILESFIVDHEVKVGRRFLDELDNDIDFIVSIQELISLATELNESIKSKDLISASLLFVSLLQEINNLAFKLNWVYLDKIDDILNTNENVFNYINYRIESLERFILAEGEDFDAVKIKIQSVLGEIISILDLPKELERHLLLISSIISILDSETIFIIPLLGGTTIFRVPDSVSSILLYHPSAGLGLASYKYLSYSFNPDKNILLAGGQGGVYVLDPNSFTDDEAGLVLDLSYLSSSVKKFLHNLYIDGDIDNTYKVKIETEYGDVNYPTRERRLKIGKGVKGARFRISIQGVNGIKELWLTPILSRRSK
jgi:hypothetical protein